MRVAVLGVGLIGTSIGLALKREGGELDVRTAGFDPDPGAIATAHARGAIDVAADTVAEALSEAQACFVCAPVRALPALVEEALASAGEDCVVSDVGSTKRHLARTIGDERFVGGHPIAGSESSGAGHARADLFDGAPWYLTPGERSSGLLYERLHRLIAETGARPAAIDADVHDRVLAAVSHLPHVLANVLVAQAAGTLAQEDEALPQVGPSFRDATRVAGANSRIWTDIYATNAESIAAEIDETVRRLREAAEMLRGGDPGDIERWNEAARGDRRSLLEEELAGGTVHELRVSVPNRPGIVAQVALALGRARVNIVDMALAPAPDMRSGSMTFWIAGDEQAARARALIEELGFPVAESES